MFDIILPKVRGLVVCHTSCGKELSGGDFRIPKCQKRKSLGNLISVNRKIGTSLGMRRFRFGVIVGLRRSLGGGTLILVRSPSILPPLFLPADVVMDTDNYTKICTIEADLSHITLTPRYERKGERGQYFRLDYDLVLLFGLTELKAQVAWRERVRVLRFLYSPCSMLTFGLFFCVIER